MCRYSPLQAEDANRTLDGGRKPLHYAADFGQTDVVEFLISKGADVNAPDKHGLTPLISACFEGHTSCVKVLLDKPLVPASRIYQPAAGPLHSAGRQYCWLKDKLEEAASANKKKKYYLGADKDRKGPDGIIAFDAAESEHIKALLK
ncbi:hypothetical protein INR49_005038 [Caranx melampygus]|nr:hypothetical protein INR49_005038 [Caranx melampygus]